MHKTRESIDKQQEALHLPDDYDSGLLNDYGGGAVEWWQDYIREEVARCNDYWRNYFESLHGNER